MTTIVANDRASAADRAALREARLAVEEFHYEYAAVLERMDIERWPSFFADDAVYEMKARDNEESGLRLALMYCEGMGMLKDRAYAIKHTEMYAPRYLNLMITNTRVLSIEGPFIQSEAGYLLLETLIDEPTRVQQAGKYYDRFERRDGRLIIKERLCVYDSVLINNCVVFPV